MIATQLRRMLRWQKLQRFRARPGFDYIRAYNVVRRGAMFRFLPMESSMWQGWFGEN